VLGLDFHFTAGTFVLLTPTRDHDDETLTLPAELYGYRLLADARLNKGTAFTEDERTAFGLHGLLPPTVFNIDDQVRRRMQILREFHTDLERYAFLRELQDTNEMLYYALLAQNVEELLPIVYTPTVGAGCKSFSRLFRKPRGVFLSMPHRHRIREILANPLFDKTEVIVVTDGERILGLGDQGAGGMGIPIGKLALYTACGGIDPATALPILLDVGTDNEDNLNDPLYIGWRHKRVRGADYDGFIEEFISAVKERWPHVLLQWEDFAKINATRLLNRYRGQICSFNDDIQGTAAVATGTLLAAINVTGVPMAEQRIAILGGGSAGCGIAHLLMAAMVDAGLDPADAARRFYLVDKDGLMIEGMNDAEPFQLPFLQPRAALSGWNVGNPNKITLLDVIYNAKPTALIGVSAQAGAFTESVVRAMAKHNQRPIVFPLSNPISCAEATPGDVERWSEGHAMIGCGSPFPPIVRNGKPFAVDQTNNSYIFPGIGLGVIATHATRITDKMLMAAAMALAELSPARHDPAANLLPRVTKLREVAIAVATAVGKQAFAEGLTSGVTADGIEDAVRAKMWSPRYLSYRRAGANK
jgi:malate dehydrogenase (oxaloacetate-decarboxylating)